ncbi:MAG: esterase/lipase family protein [Arcobacter sp.]|uniref:esterase/lipase family protein n=1 Tax=Arcobacter sp. TaxID=1872629 RepID=UPI003CFF7F90
MEKKVDFYGINPVNGNNKKNIQLDIIFIHGLNGHSKDTWESKNGEFWPYWLGEDFDNVAVWTIGYDASPSSWSRDTMPMEDRALSILNDLVSTNIIGTRPILFIVHSMGGLILKFMLEKSAISKEYKIIVENTKGIFFLATPHKGSSISDLVMKIESILRLNDIVKELRSNNSLLEKLENQFKNIVRSYELKCVSFFETKEIRVKFKLFWKITIPKGLIIVNKESASGQFNQQEPIGVDKDHLNICKLELKSDQIYKNVIQVIKEILDGQNNSYEKILNDLENTEKKKKLINRIFLIFNADNISNTAYNVVGYIEDNDEYESDFLEFTFEDIHNESQQEEFLRLLHEKSQLVNIPVHFILPPELFLVNFKLWKYNGTELIKIYDILFHNKNKFSMNKRAYSHMIDDWNTKFDTLKHKSIFESLLAINNTNDTFDCRNDRLGAYFNYQPEIHTNINKIVKFTNIGIWNYSSGDIIDYKQWLTAVTLDNVNIESRKYDHVALLWDDMSLLKDLKEIKG